MTDEQSPGTPEPRAVRILTRSRAHNAARADRRRRTANDPRGPRTEKVEVVLSPQEKAELKELADLAGVSMPRLLREAVFSAELPVSPDEFRELVHELFRVQGALRGIGNNVNQIAKAVNATHELGELGDQLDHALSAVRRYADRAGVAIEAVTRW